MYGTVPFEYSAPGLYSLLLLLILFELKFGILILDTWWEMVKQDGWADSF